MTEIMIGTTSSEISYQLRDIYSICRCCWKVATYKWKVHNGKIEIISFVVRLPLWFGWPLWNICVTNDHGYVPFVVNTSRSFLSSFMTYHRVCNKINTTGPTSGAGTAYHSGAHEFTQVFSGEVLLESCYI
jgi:hypothetical protein